MVKTQARLSDGFHTFSKELLLNEYECDIQVQGKGPTLEIGYLNLSM